MQGLAEALRYLRKRAGLSQAEVSSRAGITQAMLSGYERGGVSPEIGSVDRVLRAMGYDLADLEDALRIARGEEPRTPSSTMGGDSGEWMNRIARVTEEELKKKAPEALRSALEELLGGHREG
jgi:transcriptional regulator with XRE-family HTH domain